MRKRGKEKLRFRIMNKRRVTTKDFKYLKRLFLECLKENRDVEKQLDLYYKRIQVCFFYEQTDLNVEKALRQFLEDPTITRYPDSAPAFTRSRKGLGCIMVFLKHLREFSENRKDIENIEAYHKNGIFEELCHLVEQKGDSSVRPESYWKLWNLFRIANKTEFGNEILARLDTDRNHYEVYNMMMRAYPKEWIERYWKYYMGESPEIYEQRYQQWKKNIPMNIVYARLLTDTLRMINVLHVARKVPREKLSSRHKKRLDILIKTGKRDVDKKKSLIERDMGAGVLSLIDSLDESIFKTPEIFFSVVLDLWKSVRLV